MPPEPGSSVFGPPAGSPPSERRGHPGTEIQPELPDAGEPYPPYPDQPGHPGESPYPGQVHVPAPPPEAEPGYADYPEYPEPPLGPPPGRPGVGGRLPRRADRAGPGGRRAGRRSGDDGPSRGPGPSFPFGAGALVGVLGLTAFLLGLIVLPWFTVAGEEVALSDLRTAFSVPETDPQDLPGAGDGEPPTVPSPDAGVPAPGEVGDAVEDEVRDAAAQAAADAIDSGKARYLELYVERLWIVAAIAVGLAVLFSTILAPRSFALSLILGFRRLSGFVTVLVGAAHGAALWIVFTGTGAPTPDFGVWLGIGGLAAVLVACIIGPKR